VVEPRKGFASSSKRWRNALSFFSDGARALSATSRRAVLDGAVDDGHAARAEASLMS